MVKLWNVKGMDQNYVDTFENLQPYINLRGHTGPILAITGFDNDRQQNENMNLLFTAGSDGIIRVWNTPT